MLKMSLVVITFEGILGEITKQPLFDPEAKHGLYLRQGVVKGMIQLLRKFQVVLVITSSTDDRIAQILNYFKSHKVVFDGVYTRQTNTYCRDYTYFSYLQILNDFEISLDNAKWEALFV
jgi:hypothetical protein